jgi:hypothetical protein
MYSLEYTEIPRRSSCGITGVDVSRREQGNQMASKVSVATLCANSYLGLHCRNQ